MSRPLAFTVFVLIAAILLILLGNPFYIVKEGSQVVITRFGQPVSGAITQTSDKNALLDECIRILAPGGYLSCYEWMRSERDYSDDMCYWFKLEGLTYTLEMLDDYANRFTAAGFKDVTATDATHWYREEARREYESIKGELYNTMIELLGQEDADHFVENWRAMVVVIDAGDMRQGYCRGRK